MLEDPVADIEESDTGSAVADMSMNMTRREVGRENGTATAPETGTMIGGEIGIAVGTGIGAPTGVVVNTKTDTTMVMRR